MEMTSRSELSLVTRMSDYDRCMKKGENVVIKFPEIAYTLNMEEKKESFFLKILKKRMLKSVL